MSQHLELGVRAENIASQWLREHGVTVLEQRWRPHLPSMAAKNLKVDLGAKATGKVEIDIIAQDHNTLLFVEVKSRTGSRHGFPEAGVSFAKAKRIARAAEEYLDFHPWQGEIRFDIISIIFGGQKQVLEVEHFKDAIAPGIY